MANNMFSPSAGVFDFLLEGGGIMRLTTTAPGTGAAIAASGGNFSLPILQGGQVDIAVANLAAGFQLFHTAGGSENVVKQGAGTVTVT